MNQTHTINNTYENYDEIAENVFGPIYGEIAASIVERTGISRGRLLDIGCGGGHMGFAVMNIGDYEATFCDIRPDAISQTLNRAEKLGLKERVRARQEDVHTLSFPDRAFDLIVSRGSMPFWDNQIQAFSELYRVLAPGGKAYVGGGLGGPANQKRIRQIMEQRGQYCFNQKNSKALASEEYICLFDRLGSHCRVIDNPDEGRWLIFGKESL